MESNRYLISQPSSHPESAQRLAQYRKQAEREESERNYRQEMQQQKEDIYLLQDDCQEKNNLIRLSDEVREMCQMKRSLYVVANRGPVEYQLTEDQRLEIKSGAGGVSSALNSFKEYDVPVDKWFSSPMSEGDRKVMGRWVTEYHIPYRFVPLHEKIYHNYYNEISNKLLWFVLHGIYNQGQHDSEIGYEWFSCLPPSWFKKPSKIEKRWKSYTRANQAFADTVHAEMKRDAKKEPIVMIHDYHFLQLPGMLRKFHPTIILQYFIHVPWPEPKVWQALPPRVSKKIYRGMSKNDIIGFQTKEDARNFLEGAKHYLRNSEINFENSTVRWQGHNTKVRVYPISISVEKVRKTAKMGIDKLNYERGESVKEVQKERKSIQGLPEKIQRILRVDRIEPTKNIVAGFKAYDLMLERTPELHGKIVFQCRLVPSRQKVPIYQDLREEIESVIEKINKKYGKKGWKPIDAFFGHDYPGALAEMVSYDVLLVNPIKDGMNLVVKEGAVVNQNNGVLILSQTAGAFHELKDWVIPLVSPSNVEETAEALKDALIMPLEEREHRATSMRETVERNDLVLWLSRQLHDINAIPPQSSREERMKAIAPPMSLAKLVRHLIFASRDMLFRMS